jgi:hypothetical protein
MPTEHKIPPLNPKSNAAQLAFNAIAVLPPIATVPPAHPDAALIAAAAEIVELTRADDALIAAVDAMPNGSAERAATEARIDAFTDHGDRMAAIAAMPADTGRADREGPRRRAALDWRDELVAWSLVQDILRGVKA